MKYIGIVWYNVETNEIFTSLTIDSLFYYLSPLDLDKLILLGDL